MPRLDHNAEEENTQRQLGDGHSQDGKRLPDHLQVNRMHCFVHRQGHDGLSKTVLAGESEKHSVQKQEDLASVNSWNIGKPMR